MATISFDFHAIAAAIVTEVNNAIAALPIDAPPIDKQTKAMEKIVEGVLQPVIDVIGPLLP